MRDREGLQHQAITRRALLEFEVQPRLADPRLADHAHDLPVPGLCLRARFAQLLKLAGTADKARQPAAGRYLQPRAQRAETEHFEHGDRLGQPLDRRRAERLEREIALGQLVRVFAHDDRAGHRDAFHARRDVDRVPHRVVVGVQVLGADRAHHHFAGVDADADLQCDPLCQTHAVGVAAHLVLHAQRRIQRPLRMVFVRDRRAEQRQDAVAHRLGHIAFVVMHGLHHQRQCRVDQAARVFGIEIVDQRGRAGHVGEQRGDRLALAVRRAAGLHRRLCRPDAFGQIGRGVFDGGAGRRRRARGRPAQRRAAFAAELGARAHLVPAGRADAHQHAAAFFAELGKCRILKPAACAAHRD